MNLPRRAFLAALAAVVGAPAAAQQPIAAAEARALVEGLIRDLSSVEQLTRPGPERDRALDSALGRYVALDRVGRFLLGASRQQATPAELAEYDRLVPGFILADVRGEIAKLVAQSIAIEEVQARSDREALVRSRFRRRAGGSVRVDWRVQRLADGSLRIVDVFVNGVSRFVIRRDEFQAVVRSGGMPALLALLRKGPGA
ncbi:MAG: ABC transporter substrate-binding protein [Sphingomonadaceae bacterium]|uniref:ABC transporter substrate-binding protein n=1 Tax=Thermaurantiacus sp. TaxID=2820283 RepID=UPI00298F2160|nr:ABC transporter substrate-binding protein [Thermaurantiacus sp.]MCS6987636.1 ABC transporter substrate-binding protein [Sphingomonadaceae bacterium]MDW8415237.1 ABC transporter substrate-binding protein [Thermaurantiacus sp.]